MHKSRLATLVIDCESGAADAVRFWGEALGIPPNPDDRGDQRYFHFLEKSAGLHVLLQDMNKQEGPAFHVDIETDDVEAEVERLEALGGGTQEKGQGLVGDALADRPRLLRYPPLLQGFSRRGQHLGRLTPGLCRG